MINLEVTEKILSSCFEVRNILGLGFLETVYKKSLIISMEEKGLKVRCDKKFEIHFKNRLVGNYIPDIVVNDVVLVELKSCETLIKEHQAQVINYLKVTNIQTGLLVNFGKTQLQYKRLYHPNCVTK